MSPSAAKAAKRAEELLKRFDKNGDGKIDDDERAEAKEAMMKEQIDRQIARASALPGGLEQYRTQALAMFDKNRDGRLDDEERTEAQKFAEAQAGAATALEQLNQRFDKNGDGKVDPEERTQIDGYLRELRGLGAIRMRDSLLRRFDRNADAKLDDAEMTELEKVVRPIVEKNPPQLQRHDKNGDGKLDDAEWSAARTAIGRWMNTNGPAPFHSDALQERFGGDVEAELARLQSVAQEVARRRELREAAQKAANAAPK